MFKHLLADTTTPHAAGAAPVDCGGDPVAALRQMFVDMVMGRRVAAGQAPVLRAVFLKAHGVALGTFTVLPDLPRELRVGVFGQTRFPAAVRSPATPCRATRTSQRRSASRSSWSASPAASCSSRTPSP